MSASASAAPRTAFDPAFRPAVWEDMIVDRAEGAVFLLHPWEPRWALSNETGAALARAFDGGLSIGEAAEAVASASGIGREAALADTTAFVEQLHDANMLRNRPLENEVGPKLVREPHRLTIYITEECNLRCRHCFVVEGRMPKPKLSTEDVRALIDEHAALHPGALIAFTGGEAMLRDDCLELMAHAHARTGKVTLNTNGLLVTDAASAKALVDTRAGIQVSLDGADPEVHDFIRGKGTYAKTWRAIELMCEAGGARRLRTSTTLTRCALKQVKELVARAESLDLYEIRFLTLNRLKAAVTNWCAIAPDAKELLEVYRWLLLELPRTKRSGRTQVQGEFPGFVPYPDPRGKHWCPIGETTIVDSQGNTYGCPTLMMPEYRTGSVERQSLADIQRSERHRHLRETMLQRRWAIAECKTCSWRNFCQGGCQAFTELRTGSTWTMDEFCDFRRELYRKNAMLDAQFGPAMHGPNC